ncbi:MAG: F0F1 ATP synthase subunit A [Chloroflexi bacterium]|nr:F0F1 ATP synthase subunit A [Chloroflexota bacterium]
MPKPPILALAPAAQSLPNSQPPIPIGEHWLQTGSGLLAINWDTIIMTWIIIAIIVVPLLFLSRRFTTGIPKGIQNVYEYVVEFVSNQAEQSVGERANTVLSVAVTLFVFILLSNYLGLIPIPYFKSPTSDLNTTLAMGIFVFILVQWLALRERGVRGQLRHLTQPYLPFLLINIIDELSRPVTLSFRLFGNIVAGEIMIIILQALLYHAPFFLLLPMPIWLGFSFFVGLIQAFIFMMLTIAYIGLAIEHHDEGEAHADTGMQSAEVEHA